MQRILNRVVFSLCCLISPENIKQNLIFSNITQDLFSLSSQSVGNQGILNSLGKVLSDLSLVDLVFHGIPLSLLQIKRLITLVDERVDVGCFRWLSSLNNHEMRVQNSISLPNYLPYSWFIERWWHCVSLSAESSSSSWSYLMHTSKCPIVSIIICDHFILLLIIQILWEL